MRVKKEIANYVIEDANLTLYMNDIDDLLMCQEIIDGHINDNQIVTLTLIWQGDCQISKLDTTEKSELFRWLDLLPILTVGVASSHCSKDVFLLLMVCDLRLGSDGMIMTFPDEETILEWHLKERCMLLMGKRKMTESYDRLLERTIHSKELYDLNFINHVLDEENLLEQVNKYIRKMIVDKSHYQIKAIMKCFNNYKKLGLTNNRNLLLEQEYIQFCNLITRDYFK